jgi:hypothetical protein
MHVLLIVSSLLLLYWRFDLLWGRKGHDHIRGDAFLYRAIGQSIAEDHDLILNNNMAGREPFGAGGQLALGADGRLDRLVPKHAILMPLVSLPFYRAFGNEGLLYFEWVCLLGLAVLLYAISKRYADVASATAVALLWGATTLFLDLSQDYSIDVFGSLLLLSGTLLALRGSYEWAALVLGISIAGRLQNLPLVAVVSLFVATQLLFFDPGPRSRAVARGAAYGVILALSLIPFLASNQALYGAPFTTGYQRAVDHEGIDDHTLRFDQPWRKGLARILYAHKISLLPRDPVLLLSLAGVIPALRHARRRELALLGSLALAQHALYAPYQGWSDRYLLTTVAVGAPFAALTIDGLQRAWSNRLR